jgi:hypothetical protein
MGRVSRIAWSVVRKPRGAVYESGMKLFLWILFEV